MGRSREDKSFEPEGSWFPVLTVTNQAASAIRDLCQTSEAPEGAGLRIYAAPINETQASLELTLAPEPVPGDEVVEAGGATVYLESNAATFLDDKVLDAEQGGEGIRFSINEQDAPDASGNGAGAT